MIPCIFRLWPTLDDALRRAIARGVNVKILSAAIHHPEVCKTRGYPLLTLTYEILDWNPFSEISSRSRWNQSERKRSSGQL